MQEIWNWVLDNGPMIIAAGLAGGALASARDTRDRCRKNARNITDLEMEIWQLKGTCKQEIPCMDKRLLVLETLEKERTRPMQ